MNIERQTTRKTPLVGLAVVFGLLYFVQGIAEPTEGLIAQPVRSLLMRWNFSADSIGRFAFLIALPWSIKPLFGLLSDFVPLCGRRRKSWLLLSTSAAGLGLLALFLNPPQANSYSWLLVWLLIPTVGVALSDVVIDALMVETGQPLGITGQLQSVQWACMYAAMILTGSLGGWLAQHEMQTFGFLICAVTLLSSVALVGIYVREPVRPEAQTSAASEFKELIRTVRNPAMLAMGCFLLLLNFNPFSVAVLQSHMTQVLNWEDQFYGHTVSLQAAAAVVASVAYGSYCRRLSIRWLVNWGIVLGVLATAAYWLMWDRNFAIAVSLCVGFSYTTATLVQMDLAARLCPPQISATVFASLMAITNIGISVSYVVGGYLYENLAAVWNRTIAFQILVGTGALTTAMCWLLSPTIVRSIPDEGQPSRADSSGPVR